MLTRRNKEKVFKYLGLCGVEKIVRLAKKAMAANMGEKIYSYFSKYDPMNGKITAFRLFS